MIEAVLFDIDGTLLDHDAASGASLRAALEAEQVALDEAGWEETLAEWRRLERLHYDDYMSGAIDVGEQRRRRVAGILDWLGRPEQDREALDEWFEAFLSDYKDHWRAYDDVGPVLDRIEAAGLPLGVITNADGSIQRRKLTALGLAERLPTFIAASEAGAAKPDPEIFVAGCRQLELPAARVAYVGDRLDIDARAARDAGLLGIWVDRSGEAAALAERGEEPGVPMVEALTELSVVLGFD